jgi:hypothetical protein
MLNLRQMDLAVKVLISRCLGIAWISPEDGLIQMEWRHLHVPVGSRDWSSV